MVQLSEDAHATRAAEPPSAGIENRFLSALAAGDRRECLRAVRTLHRSLRGQGRAWALDACRVWLTAMVGQSPVPDRAVRRVRGAGRALAAAGRRDWACRAASQEGRLALLGEQWERARTRLSAACTYGGPAGESIPPVSWAALWARLGHAHWGLGDVVEAGRAWRTALAIAERADLAETAAACHANLGLCLWAQGQPAAGYVHASTALNWYRTAARLDKVAQTLLNAALMLEDFGHWRDATVLIYEARETALQAGDLDRIAVASIELVHAYVALGRAGDAVEELGAAWRASRAARSGAEPEAGRRAELWLAEADIRLAERRDGPALELLRHARSLRSEAGRPVLTRRVARHLSLGVQASGAAGEDVIEMLAIIQSLSAAETADPRFLLIGGGDTGVTALATASSA